MVSSRLSGRNNPLPIEKYPLSELILTNGHLYPWEPNEVAWAPTKAPKVKFRNIPAELKVSKPGYITAISSGTSRALHRAGMYNYERAYKLLVYMGYAGQAVFRHEFIDLLSEYFGPSTARMAFDEFSGKLSNRHASKDSYKHQVSKGRKLFTELVVKIAHVSTITTMLQQAKITTNSGKRGRKFSKWVYIPKEEDLISVLIAAGLANEADKLEFLESIPEPYVTLANAADHKAWVMGTKVDKKAQYSRAYLASFTDISVGSVRKYAERMGIEVTPNPPERIPLKKDEIPNLPKDEVEYDRWVALELIPEGTHIETKVIVISQSGYQRTKWESFSYTRSGAEAAVEYSKKHLGSGHIFEAHYSMSTYDPSNSVYAQAAARE